jgi:uncharacterized protein Yka (UPF0111/DUF47 family)
LALHDLVDHFEDVGGKYEKIKRIEHQGDIITHEIFTKLRETFITPLEREDIHDLASGLDDVLDCIDGVASRMYYFKVARPGQARFEALSPTHFASRRRAAASQSKKLTSAVLGIVKIQVQTIL